MGWLASAAADLLRHDPHQHTTAEQPVGASPCPAPRFTQFKAPYNGIFKRLYDRLDAVLTVMSYCSGATCRNPFIAIHPDGRCVARVL